MSKHSLVIFLALTLFVLPCGALQLQRQDIENAIQRGAVIKIKDVSDKRCIEYFSLDDEDYCSVESIVPTSTPSANTQDLINMKFDERQWDLAWTDAVHNTDGSTKQAIMEYVPHGDNINSWTELVTVNYLPFSKIKTPSPRAFFDLMMATAKPPYVKVISESDDELIYEFRITEPRAEQQHEIQRIIKSGNTLYVIHYVKRVPVLDAADRDKWLEIIRSMSLK